MVSCATVFVTEEHLRTSDPVMSAISMQGLLDPSVCRRGGCYHLCAQPLSQWRKESGKQ